MWYKNAIIYLLPDGWQLEAGFAEKLEQAAFTPCMGLDVLIPDLMGLF